MLGVVAVLSLLTLAVTSMLIRLPDVHEVTVIATDGARVRVAGLGVPDLSDGTRATLVTPQGRFTGSTRDRIPVPDSEAAAVVLVLDDADVPMPDAYSTALLDLGTRPVAVVVGGTW